MLVAIRYLYYIPQFNLTPLMLAAYNGHSMLVELLLAKEADPNLRDDVSHFSLHGHSASLRVMMRVSRRSVLCRHLLA